MDEERILSKIDEMSSYLNELNEIKPVSLNEYKSSIKIKRSCERLLQITIECVIDICNILISELRLGLPSDEEEIFDKLSKNKIISKKLGNKLNDMKGFRNILVHKYGLIDDERAFENLGELSDFEDFKDEILRFLKGKKN